MHDGANSAPPRLLLRPDLAAEKSHFAELAVDAVLRLKGSTNLDSIQIIKKPGGTIKVRPRLPELRLPSFCFMRKC